MRKIKGFICEQPGKWVSDRFTVWHSMAGTNLAQWEAFENSDTKEETLVAHALSLKAVIKKLEQLEKDESCS